MTTIEMHLPVGSGCPDTLIEMADGTMKRCRDLEAGDQISLKGGKAILLPAIPCTEEHRCELDDCENCRGCCGCEGCGFDCCCLCS